MFQLPPQSDGVQAANDAVFIGDQVSPQIVSLHSRYVERNAAQDSHRSLAPLERVIQTSYQESIDIYQALKKLSLQRKTNTPLSQVEIDSIQRLVDRAMQLHLNREATRQTIEREFEELVEQADQAKIDQRIADFAEWAVKAEAESDRRRDWEAGHQNSIEAEDGNPTVLA